MVSNPDKTIVYEKRKLALIEEITVAFDGVSREDGVTLHEATVIDDYGSPAERAEAWALDTENIWQDVPEADIRLTDAVLSFLDPKGFHYYIPAYMIWYLRNIDNEDPNYWSNTFDSVVFHLTYKIDEDDYVSSKFQLFTLAQSKAVANFLLFDVEREEALEKQYLQASLANGGLPQAEIDRILQAHEPQEIETRQALETYWKQFV